MINVSSEYKTAIDGDNREFVFKLVFTFADGTTLTVDDKRKLMSPGLSYDGATSSTGSFDIGSAIITKMDISLNNKDREFDAYTWKGASVAVYIGLILSENTEMLKIGTYYVDKAINGGVTKVIKCLGALALMDKDYVVSRAYPATVYQAYYDACTTCGVLPKETSIECGALIVAEKPDGVTCREVAGYAAMLSGGVVCEDPNGQIYIKHYDTTIVKTFTKLLSRSIEETDISITGIQVSYEEEIYQSGTEDYALAIEDNPLITSTESAETTAGTVLQNLKTAFRPMTIKTTLDPALQPGDRIAVVSSEKTYYTFATSVKWTLNGGMTIVCGAKTESDQSSDRYSAVSKTIITSIAKKTVNEAINAYDLAATQLNSILTNAMGYYETVGTLEDGSQVYYAHDKPTLEESQIVYKRTVDVFGYSTDGGKTYTSGWTAEGNILAQVLTAIGVNADWIRTGDLVVGGTSANKDGSIKVYDASNKLICRIDKSGLMALLGEIGGWKITDNAITSPDNTLRLDSGSGTITGYEDGKRRVQLGKQGVRNYDAQGNLIGLTGVTDLYGVNDDGSLNYGDFKGSLMSAAVEDDAVGWAITAKVDGSGIEAKQRRVWYERATDTFHFNCKTDLNGGINGGTRAMEHTVLWEGAARYGTISLNDSINKYDIIAISVAPLDTVDSQSGWIYRLASLISYQQYDVIVNTFFDTSYYITLRGSFTNDMEFVIDTNMHNGWGAAYLRKIVGIKFSTRINYSLEEQCIGTWVDGKPLYQKTVSFPLSQNVKAGYYSYDVGLANADKAWVCDGFFTNDTVYFTHNTVRAEKEDSAVNSFGCYIENSKVVVSTGINRSRCTAYITIRYIKK